MRTAVCRAVPDAESTLGSTSGLASRRTRMDARSCNTARWMGARSNAGFTQFTFAPRSHNASTNSSKPFFIASSRNVSLASSSGLGASMSNGTTDDREILRTASRKPCGSRSLISFQSDRNTSMRVASVIGQPHSPMRDMTARTRRHRSRRRRSRLVHE